MGIVHEKLFKVLLKKIENNLNERITLLSDDELSFCLRGIIKLK